SLLGLGSTAVVIVLLLSALCIYFSRRSILRLGREYEEFCGKRVFYLLGQNTDIFSNVENGAATDSYLFRLVKGDSRFAGRVLRMLLSLIIPGLTLVVAGTVLIYLETYLTLLIAVLASVFAYYQIKVSKDAAKHSMRFEKLAPAAGREYRGMLQHCKQQICQDKNQGLVERMFAKGPVKNQLDSYEGRLRAVEKSRLISGIFMAVILGLIILVMGTGIVREGQGWGRLLIYVVALRFAMTNLQTVFSTITAINRFYPQVRRYSLFVQSFEDQDREQYPVLDEYELRVDTNAVENVLEGSESRAEVKPGRRMSLVTPLELNRYTMASMARAMLGDDERAFKGALYSMRFAAMEQSCPGMSLRRVLELEPDAKWPDIRVWFADQETFERARKQLPGSLDKEINPKVWDQVDPGIKFILGLVSARQSDCQWVLIEARGLKSLGLEAAKFYLDLFRDRIAVMVFNKNLDQAGSLNEHLVAVMDQESLVGLGSPEWFASVWAHAGDMLDTARGKAAGRKAGGGMQEEDEEEV
uniref:hypothetical protein n=1 Tax=Desulfonatronospira sp. TaxID=1962951 RepID=UPI0025B98123